MIRPPALRPGDRVAVIAPSGPVDPALLDSGVAVLTSWGLEVTVMPHVREAHRGFLAGPDEGRAADLRAAWTDPGIRAVFCARGGYGAQRIIDLLDWSELAAAGPKILAGSSDITALHEEFGRRLGLVTLHGPMPATGSFHQSAANRAHLRRTLFDPASALGFRLEGPVLVPGTARGVLAGGNATLLAASIGAPGWAPPDGCLLLLEEVGEEPYRLDRILTQLLRAGVLAGARGVVLGDFTACGPPTEVADVLCDRLAGLGVPVVAGLAAGHGHLQLTVPLGVRAVLETGPGQGGLLTLDEPALVPSEERKA